MRDASVARATCASKPQLGSVASSSLPTTTAPSSPALEAMVLHGTLRAWIMISTPKAMSELVVGRPSSARDAYSSAVPPPATMPSSTAARVALSASVTRSFFSLTSVSVAPPTRRTATPPESFANRSCSFSFSYLRKGGWAGREAEGGWEGGKG